SPRGGPGASTPTGSWACGSAPPASAPPSRSRASRAVAPGCGARWSGPPTPARCCRELGRPAMASEHPADGEPPGGGPRLVGQPFQAGRPGARPVALRLLLGAAPRLLREGLRRSMPDQGFDIVGEARDGDEAIQLADELLPDVILMDVTMPEVDGVEAT